MKPTIVCAGYLNIDITAYVPYLPRGDQRVTAVNIQRTLGGIATNVACAAASLGNPWPVQVELIAFVGDDLESDWALREVNRRGVNVNGVVRRKGSRAPFCLILVEPDGKRAIVSEPIQFDEGLIGARIHQQDEPHTPCLIYVDGYRIPSSLDHIQTAHEAGWKTSVDLDGLPDSSQKPEILSQLSACFDLVFMNRGMARAFWPDLPEGSWDENVLTGLIQRISGNLSQEKRSSSTILLTLGEQGAWVIALDQSPLFIPTLNVRSVDTTGAGDVFAGVLLATWINGEPLAKAARLASAAAALSTTEYGAQGLLPSGEQVLQTFQQFSEI
jgi:ribokinase